jgi:predicted ATPase
MPLLVQEFYAAGYRSLRNIRFPVDPLSVFIGANDTGKTNLYRCLQLLQAAAEGRLSQELAAEGGMEAVWWAGRRNARQPVRMRLQVGLADTVSAA